MAVASFAACVKEVPAPTPNPRPEIEVVKEVVLSDMSFNARLGESLSPVWAGQVMVYDNVPAHEANTFEATQINGNRAVLKGKAYNPSDMYYALYPATAFGAFQDGKTVRGVPAAQAVKADDEELAPDAQVAFAQALSTEMKFTSVTAYASFTVKAAELVSFTLRAAADENLAGQTEIDVFQKEVSRLSGEKVITVTADGKEMFENKTYAVEVLPGVYKDGFVVELTFKDGSTYTNVFPYAVEIKCGDVHKVGDIEGPVDYWASWTDITASYAAANNIDFGANITMFKTETLNDIQGNVGYIFKVPAGKLDMKVAEKWNVLGDGQRKISQTVNALKDYVLFIPVQGPAVWDVTGGSSYKYCSPLAYGPNSKGETMVLRGSDGFEGTKKAYAPALGVKNGKAYIKPASHHDGKVYSYTDIKPSGEALWDVEACMSGMFLIVKDGESLIAGADDASLTAYNNAWLKFPNMTQNLSYTWTAQPMLQYEKLRNGRVIIGCTAEGDLLVLVVEKFVNYHNQGQNYVGFTPSDAGHDGKPGDTRGLDFYESAQVMKNLGCSEAMIMEDLAWTYVVLQNGSARGKDLVPTHYRWATSGTMKDAGAEMDNLVTLCIK